MTMCVKDEGAYILEWLEYYLLQGVEHFYIYNNNGTDNTRELLDSYISEGLVTWIEYPGESKQTEIYNHAITHFYHEARWMGFVDVDEFIVPKHHKSLVDFMREYEAFSQVVVRWVIYGSSGYQEKEPGLVIERFRRRQDTCSFAAKSIANPRAVLNAGTHYSEVMGDSVDEKKRLIAYEENEPASVDVICVNHYAVKSRSEFLFKKKRGDVIYGDVINDDYYIERDCNDVEDDAEYMGKYAREIRVKLSEKGLLRYAV